MVVGKMYSLDDIEHGILRAEGLSCRGGVRV